MAAEDGEEQEDVFALPVSEETVPAFPRGDKEEAGDVETDDRSGGRTAGEIMLERPGLVAGESVLERPGLAAGETETAAESARANRELWKDGLVWTVRGGSPEIDGALRAAQAGRTARAEEALQLPRDGDLARTGLGGAARGGTTGTALGGAGRFGSARAGLEGLYRQTVQGLRPAAPALPPEQAGRTARAQEPGSAASLAVDELDRAVRRDSRRYDGGMSIY